MRMLITGGLVARADGVFNTDILIEDDRILELGERLHETQQPDEAHHPADCHHVHLRHAAAV